MYTNNGEAKGVLQIVKKMLEYRGHGATEADEIVMIAPYQGQVTLAKDLIAKIKKESSV